MLLHTLFFRRFVHTNNKKGKILFLPLMCVISLLSCFYLLLRKSSSFISVITVLKNFTILVQKVHVLLMINYRNRFDYSKKKKTYHKAISEVDKIRRFFWGVWGGGVGDSTIDETWLLLLQNFL